MKSIGILFGLVIVLVVGCGKKDAGPSGGEIPLTLWSIAGTSLVVGEEVRLFGMQGSQDLTGDLVWALDDSSLAQVNDVTHTLLATNSGTTTLRGQHPELGEATLDIVIAANDPVLIAVTPPNAPAMAPGMAQQMTAVGIYNDGTTRNITRQASWASGDPTIAEMSTQQPGRVTAIGTNYGFVSLTATLGSASGAQNINVVDATVVAVEVRTADTKLFRVSDSGMPSSPLPVYAIATIDTGTVQIPVDATHDATWTVTDESVVNVIPNDLGQANAQAVAAGTVEVTATVAGVTSMPVNLDAIDDCVEEMILDLGTGTREPSVGGDGGLPDAFTNGLILVKARGRFEQSQSDLRDITHLLEVAPDGQPADIAGPFEDANNPRLPVIGIAALDTSAAASRLHFGVNAGSCANVEATVNTSRQDGFADTAGAIDAAFANGTALGSCTFPPSYTTPLSVQVGAGNRIHFFQAATGDLNSGWIAPDGTFSASRVDGMETYFGHLNADLSGTARSYYISRTCGLTHYDVTLTPQ